MRAEKPVQELSFFFPPTSQFPPPPFPIPSTPPFFFSYVHPYDYKSVTYLKTSRLVPLSTSPLAMPSNQHTRKKKIKNRQILDTGCSGFGGLS